METQQYTYYAFISYQRKHEKWAKWLHRKLENCKLPVANSRDVSDKKSKYIRPVFLDMTDLTSGAFLSSLLFHGATPFPYIDNFHIGEMKYMFSFFMFPTLYKYIFEESFAYVMSFM